MAIRKMTILAVCLMLLAMSCSSKRVLRENLGALAGKEHVVVVMYGDELSAGGDGYDLGNSWGGMLKPMLAEMLGTRVSFINSSRTNESFQRASRRVQEDILSFRPDIVLVMLGRVDAYTDGLTQSMHRQNIESLLGALSKEEKFVVVLTSPGLRSFTKAGEDDLAWFDLFTNETRFGAQLYRFPVIDVASRMKQVLLANPAEYETLFSDNVNLSEKGKQFIADFVYERFKTVLETGAGD